MTLPNFLMIGAPKCGTTSVYHYLRQHPDVFMPDNKEPMFLAYEGGVPPFARTRSVVRDLEAYKALFLPVTTERAIGEASTIYLYWPDALPRVRKYVPDAKFIAVLRDPVDRAYSNFLHQRHLRAEPFSDFASALRAEPERIAQNWAPFFRYAALGRYRSQLERYYAAFDRKKIRVYLSDELAADPLGVLQDIFRFLDVDDGFVPDVSRRHLVSIQRRVPAIGRFVQSNNRMKDALRPLVPDALRRFLIEGERRWNRVQPTVDARLRRRLVEENRDEISKLAALLDKDLSAWLAPRPRR